MWLHVVLVHEYLQSLPIGEGGHHAVCRGDRSATLCKVVLRIHTVHQISLRYKDWTKMEFGVHDCIFP